MVKVQNPFAVALVNIANSQDIGSFKKIFDYFSPRLKSFLMKSGADEAIAEEIIQETIINNPLFNDDIKNSNNLIFKIISSILYLNDFFIM